jgi:4-hydroxybenzoate polyprenyltransferase
MFELFLRYSRMIKIAHSVFALPFALAAYFLAHVSLGLSFSALNLFWVIVAMIFARSAAMGFNRLVDRRIDAANPRTARREIPAGEILPLQAAIFVLFSVVLFLLAAAQINNLALALSPVALFVIMGYSYTKRFTAFSHIALGLALAIAPMGAWIAASGTLHLPALILAAVVLFWVSGFDIVYACQDHAYDKQVGLHSIPVRFGISGALLLARLLHALAMLGLIILAAFVPASWLYLIGLLPIVGLLFYQHWLVRGGNLDKLDIAFFQLNGILSVYFFVLLMLVLFV